MTGARRMHEVGHDLFADRAVGLEEPGADIEEENALIIGQLGDDGIHLRDRVAGFVRRLSPSVSCNADHGPYLRAFPKVSSWSLAISSARLPAGNTNGVLQNSPRLPVAGYLGNTSGGASTPTELWRGK